MHKQTYKRFTLFVNDTHFGIESIKEDNTTSLVYKVPLREGFSLEDHIDFLKLRSDLYTKR